MLTERSSNKLISDIFPGVILAKPIPNGTLVSQAVENLPLDSEYKGVVGSGDYYHEKSSGGSVALKYDSGIVVKVPLGTGWEDAFSRAKKMNNSLKNFSSISPNTMVIIAKADGQDAKPITLQKEIEGKPLCDTPISSLFRLKTLQDIREIVFKKRNWYREKGAYDLCGQKTSNSLLGRIIQFVPLLSDNIMVDEAGHAFLVDNILDSRVKTDTLKRKHKDFLRKNVLHNIPLLVVDSLIIARRVCNYINPGKKEESTATTERQPAKI